MWLVEDEVSKSLPIPNHYGVDDFPVIIQDKRLDNFGTPEYNEPGSGGFVGDTLLVNGVQSPYVEVSRGWVRLRLLNASNSRRYQLQMNDGRPLHVISGDQGFLPAPVSVKQLSLAPGERREILVDMSNGDEVSITCGEAASIVDRIRGFFEPSSILVSTLVLTLRPTGLLPLVTDSLPMRLLPTEIMAGSPIRSRDIDAPGLNYKAGDSFKAAVKGKSNQPVVFVDSTGRSYAIDPITLPSARGQGEPLTGKLTLPPGATVDHMLMESDDQKLLMASDAGYGFVCTFNDLVARNRAGKALITLPENAHVMPPVVIEDASDMLLAITQAGRMLMFPVSDLPQLSKGKGNKIINIPSAEAARGEDGLAQLYVLPPQSTLTIHVGKRKIKLRPEELQKVTGERGRRGTLMRGLQRIDRVEIDSPRRASSGDSEE